MKVALILATNVEKSPYMQYYIDVYKEKNIDVEVILLNRDKRVSNEEFPYKIHSCDIIARETASCVRKIYDYFRYSRFVRRILKQSDYSQIVVFTIANAVFLSYYLLSYYKKKYIFDIRDYSPLVKYTVPIIRRLLNNSALNCFSSPGFRSWLPACDYVICHNARRKSLDEDIVNARDIDVENVKVLTIGQLRNFITNKMLMDHLGNKSRITIQFSGMGIAYDLLKKYNKDPFHIQHALTVEAVMKWYANELGYSQDAEYWGIVGLLHDIDFELYPEEHCIKAPELLREGGVSEDIIHGVVSHGYGITVDIAPEHEMEKVLFAADELTGLIWAAALMRPSKSTKDMELKSLKKKYKSKGFAAGCSREVIERGAKQLGWELEKLLTMTLAAMAASEDTINEEMAAESAAQ